MSKVGTVDNQNHEVEDVRHAQESEIAELKISKSRRKAAFTRMKNRLYDLCEEEDVQKSELKESLDKVESEMDNAIAAINDLVQCYKTNNRTEEMTKAIEEITLIEYQYDELLKSYRSCMSELSSIHSETSETKQQSDVGRDLWKQLKRVSVPVFDGDKRKYSSWWASFSACVDTAPASPEYKLLQLRQYLKGEALNCIEELGHSAEAYEAAKSRLNRKFGGEKRLVSRFMEDLEKFKPIKVENAKEIERFADLLDIAIIKLKEIDRTEDLNNGSFYQQLLKKLPTSMLTRYNRWIHEHSETESVEILRKWILLEAEFVTAAVETIHGISPDKTFDSVRSYQRGQRNYFVSPGSNKRRYLRNVSCLFCKGKHLIWSCEQFSRLNVEDRWKTAKDLKMCFRCLRNNHFGIDCRNVKACGINGCEKVHHPLLHKPIAKEKQQSTLNPEAPSFTNETTAHSRSYHSEIVALRTVPVILKYGNRSLRVNALLDDGSTRTYVNANVASELGVQGELRKMTVNVLNNNAETFDTMSVQLGIESTDGRLKKIIEASTIKNVTGSLKVVNWEIEATKYAHLREIEFPKVAKRSTVDILIGLDNSDLHSSYQEVIGREGEPIARLTPLGWTCVGTINKISEGLSCLNFFINSSESMGIERELRRFWEIENVEETAKTISCEDKTALEIVENSLVKDGQKYIAKLPWKRDKERLQVNYNTALNRLRNTEKRLIRNPELNRSYAETIKNYIQKGYVQKIKNDDAQQHGWYLPHFPIVKPDKETTKVRIVFDASAKYEGTSLNDVIYQGPKLQKELIDVLIRFRKNCIAIVCDVAEMYLRIGLDSKDQEYHKFLWRDSPENAVDTYKFTRLVFGVNASPFIAQYVSQVNADKYQEVYPLAAETVNRSTYMDDGMDSVENVEKCIELYRQLKGLWNEAGMHVRKWISNSEEVLAQIPIQDRASQVDLSKSELPSVKTLGVLWIAKDDCFSFHFTSPNDDMKLTKRNILKVIASIFDPLGLIAPFILKAKVLMQEIWISGIEWDEIVTPEIARDIKQWFLDLSNLEYIQVARCLKKESSKKAVTSMTIHTCVDASITAYGAVVYCRTIYEDGEICVRMIASKGRVAPIESTSVPRLELMGAIIGLRLTVVICRALEINIENVTFWTDSMNVLFWLRNQSRQFKSFVGNRIGEIHRLTSPNQWRYIPTQKNPADLVSRGLSAKHLSQCEMWWQGPDFLLEDEGKWPETHIKSSEDAKKEIRKLKYSSYLVTHNEVWLLDPERFSNWLRLVRIRAWVMRFLENISVTKKDRTAGPLSTHEIQDSEINIIREIQEQHFGDEIKRLKAGQTLSKSSKLTGLNPKIDSEGVMRSDGRLKFAEYLPYSTKYPIILPRRSTVTRLIVQYFHNKTNHSGTNQTLLELSSRYWIISAREEIRECENRCMECRRRKSKPAKQIMAPLPDIRINAPLKAFAHTAVDYGGPFITVQGRGRRREKRYLCLFTCLASRAVHLEVAFGLDTNSFLNAFYRMANRRGLPQKMLSDNGTNFVSADKELKNLLKLLSDDENKIVECTANKGVDWQFNPPLAPHWGGVHEIMIKTAKRAIYAILKNADITDEELITAFTGAENLINSRPLTYQSANPEDCTPLTPNHFLFGQVGGQFAPQSVDETYYNPVKRWRRIQELVSHFWQRWLREWLPGLNSRKKWFKATNNLDVGDVVIVITPNVPRGHWPLGRITKVYPSKDGLVRSASVRVGNSEVTRPIVKLCPLELGICE